MSVVARVFLLILSFFSCFAAARLITVPHDDPRILYDAGLWTFEAVSAPPAQGQGLDFLCSRLLGSNARRTPGRATATTFGAGFTFSFNGTGARILSSAGPEAAPFTVTRDPNVTPLPDDATTPVPVNGQPISECKNTYSVVGLVNNGTEHSIRLVVGTASPQAEDGEVLHGAPPAELSSVLSIFGIVYDDGLDESSPTSASELDKSTQPIPTSSSSSAPTTQSNSTTPTNIGSVIGIALGVSIIVLALIIVPLLWYLHRRGRICDGEGGFARPIVPREGEKGCDVLTDCSQSIAPSFSTESSSTAFLRGWVGTIKMRVEGSRLWSDDLSVSSRRTRSTRPLSGLTMLRPPVPS